MVQVSYSDVFSIRHERDQHEEIQCGDLVRTGPNLHPHFEVIAVHGEKVWLRNVQNGQDAVTNLSHCRHLASPVDT